MTTAKSETTDEAQIRMVIEDWANAMRTRTPTQPCPTTQQTM